MPANPASAAFAPQLIIRDGAAAIEFYKTAFGALLQNRWNNEDGSVHVAELSFQGAVFHIREESEEKRPPGSRQSGWHHCYYGHICAQCGCGGSHCPGGRGCIAESGPGL